MNTILAVDPGTTESAWLLYDPNHHDVLDFGKAANQVVLELIANTRAPILVIERITSYGMPVGEEIFETVFWTGCFWMASPSSARHRLTRREIKLHLCDSSRAKDTNVRQALLDRFGGRDAAIGHKAAPGPLRGVTGDVWAALAVAVTFAETRCEHTLIVASGPGQWDDSEMPAPGYTIDTRRP